MSLTGITTEHGSTMDSARGEHCFYCGRPVFDPVLCWRGYQHSIYLHGPCWVKMATRLFRDSYDLELIVYREGQWMTPAAAEGSRLQAAGFPAQMRPPQVTVEAVGRTLERPVVIRTGVPDFQCGGDC